MVQMRVTPGPQNPAQRTQSVSPIELVVNGLHCAASHTHTTSLRCHPHVPTFEPCRNLATFWQKWPSYPSGAAVGQRPRTKKRGRESFSGILRPRFARPAARTQRRLQPQPPRRPPLPGDITEGPATTDRLAQRGQFRFALRLVDILHPALRTRHRPGRQPIDRRTLLALPQTAPRPRFRPRRQLGTQGITLHIAADRQQVLVFLNRE